MDQLEKIIIKNKEQIQDEVPHEGHFERFEMKLDAVNKKQSKNWLYISSSIAAILVIGFIILFPAKTETNRLTLSDVSPQYSEVEFYYTSAINKQTNRLNSLTNNTEDSIATRILGAEINEYETIYEELCNDLNATPNDERVINAIVSYYQTKLDIITRILNTIEEKQIKDENNENTNI